MGLIKKFVLGAGAFILIFSSKSAAESGNIILQVGAVIGLIIALVILYIFAKMAWRAMGCLPAILILVLLVLFVMYSIGAFSGGMDDIKANLTEYFHQDTQTADGVVEFTPEAEPIAVEKTKPEPQETGVVNLIQEDQHKIFSEDIVDKFLPKSKAVNKVAPFNPMKYPAIYGPARVLSGDTLVVNGQVIRLYGIAAPEIRQTCAQSDGRGYRCGQKSAVWLNDWLRDNIVECHLIKQNQQGVITGMCTLGEYDIAAATVNAGLAVANTGESKVYVPYQEQAARNRRGLWEGKFYMPWDWAKIQNRKANIQIHKKSTVLKRAHSFFF